MESIFYPTTLLVFLMAALFSQLAPDVSVLKRTRGCRSGKPRVWFWMARTAGLHSHNGKGIICQSAWRVRWTLCLRAHWRVYVMGCKHLLLGFFFPVFALWVNAPPGGWKINVVLVPICFSSYQRGLTELGWVGGAVNWLIAANIRVYNPSFKPVIYQMEVFDHCFLAWAEWRAFTFL